MWRDMRANRNVERRLNWRFYARNKMTDTSCVCHLVCHKKLRHTTSFRDAQWLWRPRAKEIALTHSQIDQNYPQKSPFTYTVILEAQSERNNPYSPIKP